MPSDKQRPSPSPLARARALKSEAKYAEAIEVLERLLVEDPENIEALEEIADNELSLGHYDRAERAALRLLDLDTKSHGALYFLGFISSHHRQWDASIDALRRANAFSPNDPEILRCLGWSLFSRGDEVEGLVTLERSLNLEPENPFTLCDLGVCCLKLGRNKKAISLFERALAIDPENERAAECLEMVKRIASERAR